MRRTISSYHPALYALRVWQRSLARHARDWPGRRSFARELQTENLPHVLKRHQSLLNRKMGDSDPQLQLNRIVNLRLAREHIDGVMIKPGETFSFWRLVGDANAARGYLPGMRLSRGEVKVGVGGGLCQFGNLLLWMAWHSPLVVSERHHHSFDPFPDQGRVLPFGSGCSLFYPYLDLRFHNPTDATFQFRIWLDETHLHGMLTADEQWPQTFHVHEREHKFVRRDDKNYRSNEIWRRLTDRVTGNTVGEELLVKNFAQVKYRMSDSQMSDKFRESETI